jgi:hypothetical protein
MALIFKSQNQKTKTKEPIHTQEQQRQKIAQLHKKLHKDANKQKNHTKPINVKPPNDSNGNQLPRD